MSAAGGGRVCGARARPGAGFALRLSCCLPLLTAAYHCAAAWRFTHHALHLATSPTLHPAPTPLPCSTVMFVDEQGQQVSEKRLALVQGELQRRGLQAAFVEEEVEAASVGKGSVAVGEVADNIAADLVVLSTAGGWRGGGV